MSFLLLIALSRLVDRSCEARTVGRPVRSAVTRRVTRRKQKSRSSPWNCSPGTRLWSRFPRQVVRDLRPHPPHGGAASTYTCHGGTGSQSRSGHGRAGRGNASTVATETQPSISSAWSARYDDVRPPDLRGVLMSAIPASFRAYVATKDAESFERGVREFSEADIPPGEVEIRVAW